ncbi:hypothetical protein SDC9_42742 [bioreactor metagenome]|uniref:Uncharacterized protein n=1 Tax=bioreactor metagenome TaxID=1076179 RepID=A0A644VZI1_9ZZZZ
MEQRIILLQEKKNADYAVSGADYAIGILFFHRSVKILLYKWAGVLLPFIRNLQKWGDINETGMDKKSDQPAAHNLFTLFPAAGCFVSGRGGFLFVNR